MPQTDQRRDPIISFIDASDLLDAEMTTTVPTNKIEKLQFKLQLKKEDPTTKEEVLDREIQENVIGCNKNKEDEDPAVKIHYIRAKQKEILVLKKQS